MWVLLNLIALLFWLQNIITSPITFKYSYTIIMHVYYNIVYRSGIILKAPL